MDRKETLGERLHDFNSLALPGQPLMMHMGTCYLMNDLWREVCDLREENNRLEKLITGMEGK